jgi:hypothetical protein
MNYRHLSNVTKLTQKTKEKKTLLPSGPPTTAASVSDLSLTAAVFLACPAFLTLAVA